MLTLRLLGWPAWAVFLAVVVGYALLIRFNPVRSSLLNGSRALRRYPEIWLVLAGLGLAYSAWQIGLRVVFHAILPEGERPVFLWFRPWFLPKSEQLGILKDSLLPSAESVAGIFNNIITTFPLSALAALLLLVNWQGHLGVLARALRKRFGGFGRLLLAFVIVSAIAALLKPLLYVVFPFMGNYMRGLDAVRLAFGMDWFAFLFQYLFGVFIQIYLILLVYVWIRGRSFTHAHLLDFAIRRFAFVIKWACVVLVISSVFIDLPRILSIMPPLAGRLLEYEDVMEYVDTYARPALTIFLVLFATVQITLTFHSERLCDALRDHFRFVRKWGWQTAWFLVVAFVHFYLFHVFDNALRKGFGEGTSLMIGWALVYPIFAALLGGWLLASWVCLYKTCETGKSTLDDLVKY